MLLAACLAVAGVFGTGEVWATPLVRRAVVKRTGGRVCGIGYAHSWERRGRHGYGSAASRRSLDELARLGVRAINLVPFGWMKSLQDTEVRWSKTLEAGENFSRLEKSAARARARGMSLMLKPHIWVHGGAWQAEIEPDPKRGGWSAWFDSYQRFILAYAALAQRLRADWFVVGLELRSASSRFPGRWRRIIAAVRKVYRGRVTFAANWHGEAEEVRFWDAVDAIGIQMFAPIVAAARPTLAEARTRAAGWLKRFGKLARRHGKPLLLTEAGFANGEGALRQPFLWPDKLGRKRTAAGDREQRIGYQAIIETFGRSPLVQQIYWWKWFSNPDTREEWPVGYPPRGKPAERLLSAACAVPGRSERAPATKPRSAAPGS